MYENERFLYEIRPIKPIKDLIPGRSIKAPCSMQLTKEEALYCMKFGPVYRNFSDSGMNPIRVTGSNINRLHRSNFLSEESYNSMDNAAPVETVDEDSVEEVPTEIKDKESLTDETLVDEDILNDILTKEEESSVDEDAKEEEDFLPIEEEESSVTSSDEIEKKEEVEENHGNKLNYSSKNNKVNNKNHRR